MAADVNAARLSPEEVLELLPQQEPFRFVDEILEVDEDHIVARYRFRPDADFYRGPRRVLPGWRSGRRGRR